MRTVACDAPTVLRCLRSRRTGLQRVLPEAELAADEDQHDQEDVKPECGERSVVVDRSHPSWAEVNAEQQERATTTLSLANRIAPAYKRPVDPSW